MLGKTIRGNSTLGNANPRNEKSFRYQTPNFLHARIRLKCRQVDKQNTSLTYPQILYVKAKHFNY